MKKVFISLLLLMCTIFTSFAARGFAAKLYGDNNVHFMNIIVDYDFNKIKVQSNKPDINYVIVSRISNVDKTIMYIKALPESIYNYGNYDAKKVETFIFDTKLSLFSTGNSNRKIRFELYELERNL